MNRENQNELYKNRVKTVQITALFIHSFAMFRYVFLCELQGSARAVGSYSSGSPARGNPQIIILKTLRMTWWIALYKFPVIFYVIESPPFSFIKVNTGLSIGLGCTAKYSAAWPTVIARAIMRPAKLMYLATVCSMPWMARGNLMKNTLQ